MRTIAHLKPRYISSRLQEMLYQRKHPEHPWLTSAANDILASWLRLSDVGLELGSGRSTLWLANRVKHLISVEHNQVWYQKVQKSMADNGVTNVDYHFIPLQDTSEEQAGHGYLQFIEILEDNSLDFVLIDGVHRALCTLGAIDKVRFGGVIIIDNVNRYLPSESMAPGSRAKPQGPDGLLWKQVENSLKDWRCIWTSSGVTDTAFFLKPCLARVNTC